MIDDLAVAAATITLTVDNFVSVTQGMMVTSGANPDVRTAVSAHARVVRTSNDSFAVSGGSPGGNVLVLRIEVLPSLLYDAVGLFIRKLSDVDVGPDDWDDYRVGTFLNSNAVTLRDWCKVPSGSTAVDYEIYMLIKRKAASAGFPLGIGLIDPKITNL